jgi:hypothetical protein
MAIIYQSPNPLDSLFQGLNQGAFQLTVPYLLQLQEQRRKAVQDILASALNQVDPRVYASPEFQTYVEALGVGKNKHIKAFLDNISKAAGGSQSKKVLPDEANGHIVRNILKESGTGTDATQGKGSRIAEALVTQTQTLPQGSPKVGTSGAQKTQQQAQGGSQQKGIAEFLRQYLGFVPNLDIGAPPQPGASVFEVNKYNQQLAAQQSILQTILEKLIEPYAEESAKDFYIVKDFNPQLAQMIVDWMRANGYDPSPVIKIDNRGGVTYDFSRVDPQVAVSMANNLYSHLLNAMEKASNLEANLIEQVGDITKDTLKSDILSQFGLTKGEISQVQNVAENSVQDAVKLAQRYAVHHVNEMLRSWNNIIGHLSEKLGMRGEGNMFQSMSFVDTALPGSDKSAGIGHVGAGLRNYLIDKNTGKVYKVDGGAGTTTEVEEMRRWQSLYSQTEAMMVSYAQKRAKDVLKAWQQLPSFEGWSTDDFEKEIQKAEDFAWDQAVKAGVPDDPELKEAFSLQFKGALISELTGRPTALTPDSNELYLRDYWVKKEEERKKKEEKKENTRPKWSGGQGGVILTAPKGISRS